MLATGVRFDCIRLEVKDEKLLSAIHSRTRLQERTSPIQKVRDAKIDFEELVEATSVSTSPLQFSWSDLDTSQGGKQGGEQTRSEVNVQVPIAIENVLPAEQSKTAPEERTYR